MKTISRRLLVISLVYVVASLYAQQAKLIGTDNIGAAKQGYSVSLSSDGNTAIIGGCEDNSNQGAAWIFTRQGTTWTQQTKLVGTGNIGAAKQGCSVDLSSDGNSAIIGGWMDNSNQGAAWIFTRFGTTWSQQTKLVGTGNIGAARQGWSVALSSDGNTAIVGGNRDNSTEGAAWIFVRTDAIWSEETKLVGTGGLFGPEQGYSVALSSDGNTAIIGGYADDRGLGAAWVFIRSGSSWSQQGAKLTVLNRTEALGCSVALSSDGNTAIIGGWSDNSQQGTALIYVRSGTNWTQQSRLLGANNIGAAKQGYSVAISSDGNTALVGGCADNSNRGAVWIFERSSSSWSEKAKQTVAGNIGVAYAGCSVALSSDSKTAIVGGYLDNSNHGAAWISDSLLVLPVELDAFTGIPNENSILLKWKTITELNNYGFDVQRKSASNIQTHDADLKTQFSNRSWKSIGFTEGHGTSNIMHEYSFSDKNLKEGEYFYRLKQIDRDGSFYYSREIKIKILSPNMFMLNQNYPNPFNPITNIDYYIPHQSFVVVKIFDPLGRGVAVLVNERKNSGRHSVQWNAFNFASGIYLCRLKADNFISMKKLVLIQ